MLWLFFVIRFIIRLRFPQGKPISQVITRRYGRQTWLSVRNWEKHLKKWEKVKLDIIFLERCIQYDIIPKFIRFKLCNNLLQRSSFYKEWQSHLLHMELKNKRRMEVKCKENVLNCHDVLKQSISFIDLNHLLYFVHNNAGNYKSQISITHAQKLYRLGAFYKLPQANHNNTIINLSSKSLTNREK